MGQSTIQKPKYTGCCGQGFSAFFHSSRKRNFDNLIREFRLNNTSPPQELNKTIELMEKFKEHGPAAEQFLAKIQKLLKNSKFSSKNSKNLKAALLDKHKTTDDKIAEIIQYLKEPDNQGRKLWTQLHLIRYRVYHHNTPCDNENRTITISLSSILSEEPTVTPESLPLAWTYLYNTSINRSVGSPTTDNESEYKSVFAGHWFC